MQLFVNPDHARHQGRQEMFRGHMVDCHESPSRLDHVLAELQRRGLDRHTGVAHLGPTLDAALARLHSPAYLAFLASAWDDWVALDPQNATRDALPSVWPAPGMRFDRPPANFAARLGQYAFDAGTPLTAGSWQAARSGAGCALAAAEAVNGGVRAALALTRPPGHHAGRDFMGGYCFLNNAGLAAQTLRDGGAKRVAVLDIDYHHGNGTQALFYDRPDVLTVSIHGDPRTEYPFFLGHADETGTGPGVGANLNLPLPRGTAAPDWFAALQHGLDAVRRHGAEALVVALGVDTYEGDPISGFRLRSADYPAVGRALAAAGLPTVFTFEGGYAVAEIGVNAVNVIEGFGPA